MHNINQQVSEEETYPCLPEIAWVLLVVAFIPHVLALMGLNPLVQLASCGCFSASMGPFALAHVFMIIKGLGFTSHMAWISAVTFSLIWSAGLCCAWRRNKNITMGIAALTIVISAIPVWFLLTPLS
jgi:hypothetical protein